MGLLEKSLLVSAISISGGCLNLKSFAIRSLVAVIFGPLIIVSAIYGHYFWLAFVLSVVVLSAHEYYDLAGKKGVKAQKFTGAMSSAIVVLALYFYGEYAFAPVIMFSFIVFLFVEIYRQEGSPTLSVPLTLFGPIYFGLLFGSFLLIRELPGRYGLHYEPAGTWIVTLILSTWVCDTAAYVIGSYFGKHKLIERISPKKSVEGTVAGFVFSVLTAYLCHIWFVQGLRVVDSLVIGAIAGSIGQYGDLFESMFKRDAGVKDTSTIIPGHGGIMDRFDSLTISAPVVYLYLRVVLI